MQSDQNLQNFQIDLTEDELKPNPTFNGHVNLQRFVLVQLNQIM